MSKLPFKLTEEFGEKSRKSSTPSESQLFFPKVEVNSARPINLQISVNFLLPKNISEFQKNSATKVKKLQKLTKLFILFNLLILFVKFNN